MFSRHLLNVLPHRRGVAVAVAATLVFLFSSSNFVVSGPVGPVIKPDVAPSAMGHSPDHLRSYNLLANGGQYGSCLFSVVFYIGYVCFSVNLLVTLKIPITCVLNIASQKNPNFSLALIFQFLIRWFRNGSCYYRPKPGIQSKLDYSITV